MGNTVLEIVNNTVIGILIVIVHTYIWSKLFKEKLIKKNLYVLIILVFMTLAIILNFMINEKYLKIILGTIILLIFCKLLSRKSIANCILASLISQFILMISEIIFTLLMIFITDMSMQEIADKYTNTIIINSVVSVISILIAKFCKLNKLFDKIITKIDRVGKYEMTIFTILLIITVSLLEVSCYYKINRTLLLIINTSFIFFYTFIILKMFNTKNEYLIIDDKYNKSKNSLDEYQSVINRYRIDNHENKGQLRRLKSKIDSRNTVAMEYIDEILKLRVRDNEKILNKTKIIPECDLKVIMDAKIVSMEKQNIKNIVHVDNEIRTVDFIEMDNKLMDDICKIIGVYLDNAIEAVEDLSYKEISLNIYVYEDDMYISVVNNYGDIIDLDKIGEVGYTTKSDGHGYGLPLVSEIIEKNPKLDSETYVDEKIFKQTLKISDYK